MHTDDGVMRLLRSSKARCGQRSQSTTNALSGKKLAPSPSRAPRVERTAWEADKKRQRPSSSVWMTSSEFLKLTGCARVLRAPLGAAVSTSKADIEQPLLTNLDLWVDALKTPLSHYFWGAGGSGAPTWLTSPSIWGRILKSDRGMRSPAALIAGAMALGFGAVFFRPCDYVPPNRACELACLPRSVGAQRRILSHESLLGGAWQSFSFVV